MNERPIPWLLSLQEFMATAPLERYPIKRSELETAEEFVEFLENCWSLAPLAHNLF